MRKNYIVNTRRLALVAALGLAACQNRPAAPQGHREPAADSAAVALAQPVNMRVIADMPAVTAETGSRIYTAKANGIVTYDTRQQTGIASRVGGRIEKLLIRYNYQPVKKGQLIMEIYSPDLAAAQQELLFTAQKSPDMLAGARQRLLLLGMQPAQVTQVLNTGKILYRVPVYSNSNGYILEKTAAATAAPSAAAPAAAAGGMGDMGGGSSAAIPAPAAPAASPVMLREGQYVSAGQTLFTIYQAHNLVAEFAFPPALATAILPGRKLLYHPVSERNALQPGNVGLIEPVFRNGRNFTLARVYPGGNTGLKPGQLLTAYIPVMYATGWWLPEKAVWRLGNEAVVFRKEKGAYTPYDVQADAAVEGMVRVHTDITGWEVAANAAYLVDSESFIKTKKQWKENDL